MPHHHAATWLSAPALAGTLAALALALAGCNIAAPALALAHGPPRDPAVHTLDRHRPTVVLVDTTSANPIRSANRAAIADQASKDLQTMAGIEAVIDPRAAQSLAALDRFGAETPLSEIASAVGAEVVVHVMVDAFTLTPDGQNYLPSSTFRVKVFDAVSGERVFPSEREGESVTVTLRQSTRTLPARGADWNNAEADFARYLGTAVAQLFDEHERNSSHLRGR
ncbi:MAG: hypothetical protein KDA05_05165 [Phycisphaerales bacterium]|nr:hypothetical protein [Phycisphaerales bacterium]